MAITIKHAKTDNIADWTQSDLDAQIALGNFPPGTVLADIVLPSDWNNDHTFTGTLGVSNGGTGATTLTGYVKGNGTSAFTASSTVPSTDITGLGTMSTQNANSVAITGGSISGTTVSGYIPTTEKAVANGVATLDGSGTVPISQLPAAVLGALSYQGTWNASTNTPTLTSSVGTKGYYYVVNVAGSTNLNGITDWVVGDWAVYNGSAWQKVDNTDAVTSVNGYTGTVVLSYTDVGAAPATSGTSIFYGNGSGGFSNVTVGSGLSFSTGTLSATGSMVYPSAGIPNSTGSAWGTSYSTTGTGTVVALQTAASLNNPTISNYADWGNGSATTLAAGRMWYNGSTGSWNLGMGNGNITQQVGEELFVYGKASAAITDSPLQIVYHTGTVGASGVITFAPTIAGITDENAIVGVATESIALNGFGRVTTFGVVNGITTNGSAFGETWADDDVIWYNPVTGNPTKVKPSAPNIKFQIGTVIKAGPSGSGSFQVSLVQGTQLGGTDSNVKLTSPTNGQILTYDTSNTYWKNTSLTAGTGISVSAATGGTLTVSNSGVTSVTGTAPVVSSGGATPAISMAAANTTTNGYLTSTDWNTFNGKGSGTVTSVAALTLGTTGTDLSSTVATGTTTPVITLQVPTASASNRGALSSADWTTFNSKISSQWTTTGSDIYYNTGNVGIGTTSITRKLEVSGTSAAGSSIEIGNTNTQSSTLAAINTTGTTYSFSGVGGSTSWYYGNKTVALGTDSANPIQFIANGSERMRIDASGNVGIGTTSPVTRLDVVGGSSSIRGAALFNTSSTAGTGSSAYIRSANAYSAATTPDYTWWYNDQCGLFHPAADVIGFSTTGTERMRIDSSGNVGIGATPITSTTAILQLNGDINLNAATRSVTGNTYYAGGWKYNGNGTGGYIKFGTSSSIAVEIAYFSNNVSGAGATATANTGIILDPSGNVLVSANTLYGYQPAPTAKSAAATLTGAELMAGILSTTGTTYTITLPTGTNIDAAVSTSLAANGSFDWYVVNTASGTVTIGANGNTTLGTLTVATGVSAQFRFRKTAANTYTVYRLG